MTPFEPAQELQTLVQHLFLVSLSLVSSLFNEITLVYSILKRVENYLTSGRQIMDQNKKGT